MFNRKPVSLRRRLLMAVVNSVLLTAPIAIAMHMPINMTYATTPEHGAAAEVAADRTDAQIARLVRRNDCDLPKGVIPGHAVVTDAKGTRLAPADIGFAIWLGADEIERSGDEADGTVHAFCR